MVGRVHFRRFWASVISHEGFATQPLTNRNYEKTFVLEELQLGLLILGISTHKKRHHENNWLENEVGQSESINKGGSVKQGRNN